MVEQAQSSSLYVDANPFIYAIEGSDSLSGPIKELFLLLRQRSGMGMTSELTLAEVLPKARLPLHSRQYLDLIVWSGIFALQPVTRSILLETVRYRRFLAGRRRRSAGAMPKLPDAIHVVTAIQARCKYFLSADIRLKLPSNLQLFRPDKAGIAAVMKRLA
jgi:predicted nucleic acid-binding protein